MNVERRQRTLVIVADDLRLAQFVSSVAGRAGWRTMSHRRTDEALAAMLAGRAGIEVVIIDQERPEDNPCQLVREIRGAHPQLPILVTMSGQPAEIGTELVRAMVIHLGGRGLDWLHVDYRPELEGFYRDCGFKPTTAGLIRL